MRKVLRVFGFLMLLSMMSCNTYNYVELTEDIYVRDKDNLTQDTLSKGEYIYLSSGRKNKYNLSKIRYGSNRKKYGWVYNPRYKYYYKRSNTNYHYKSSLGRDIKVRGYYRKNGTYVRPHTRSAPRRR